MVQYWVWHAVKICRGIKSVQFITNPGQPPRYSRTRLPPLPRLCCSQPGRQWLLGFGSLPPGLLLLSWWLETPIGWDVQGDGCTVPTERSYCLPQGYVLKRYLWDSHELFSLSNPQDLYLQISANFLETSPSVGLTVPLQCWLRMACETTWAQVLNRALQRVQECQLLVRVRGDLRVWPGRAIYFIGVIAQRCYPHRQRTANWCFHKWGLNADQAPFSPPPPHSCSVHVFSSFSAEHFLPHLLLS